MHLCANIDGLLKQCSSRKLDNLFDMRNGKAKEELLKLKSEGKKLIPSEGCNHFDPYEHGCLCHCYDKYGNRIKEDF